MADQTKRDYFNRRLSSLRNERQSFISHWDEIARYIQPRRGRFQTTDRNKGDKRYNNIINSRATQAVRVARSGLLAGMMSPARPWFSLEAMDPGMMEYGPVRDWLYAVELKLRAIFNESNFYNMVPTLLNELVLFGTGAMTHVSDFDNVARFYTHTAGSYMISQDASYRVNTLVREFEWTVEQLVGAFGLKQCSTKVRDQYDKGNYDVWYPLVHFIEPNPDRDTRSVSNRNKAFRSVYYEPGQENKDSFLEESGFDNFPAYCPRWDLTNEDVYGTDCPGMVSLGDVKGLQIMERRKAQAIDKQVSPPLKGPPSIQNVPVSGLPGSVTAYAPDPADNRGLSPIYEVKPNLQDMRLDIDATERRIDEAFYVDLFLAITNMEGVQPRNQLDLIQRNEERLVQLGPVLERMQGELLNGLIDNTFNQAVAANILPPAPPELQGANLKIKYISTLAMAQRAVATSSIERVAAFAGQLVSSGFPEAAFKFDAKQALDEYAKAIGSPPTIIAPDEIAMQKEQAAAEQAQQAQQMQMMQQGADTASKIGNMKAGPDSMAGQMMKGA